MLLERFLVADTKSKQSVRAQKPLFTKPSGDLGLAKDRQPDKLYLNTEKSISRCKRCIKLIYQ